MGVNRELNELQKEVTRSRILEAGFQIFAEKTIEKVKMTDVAKAGGIGVATIYRYYKTKPELVLAISIWAWEQYFHESFQQIEDRTLTAAEEFEYYLDRFIDMYREHRALLRFNQFFNVYIENEDIPPEVLEPYMKVIDVLRLRFEDIHERARKDHTLRTDIPPLEMMLTSTHLMLAAATRYAVGLVYEGGLDPEIELLLLKSMLFREYSVE